MRRNKMKIGDVIAITRRPDTQLVRTFNSSTSLDDGEHKDASCCYIARMLLHQGLDSMAHACLHSKRI